MKRHTRHKAKATPKNTTTNRPRMESSEMNLEDLQENPKWPQQRLQQGRPPIEARQAFARCNSGFYPAHTNQKGKGHHHHISGTTKTPRRGPPQLTTTLTTKAEAYWGWIPSLKLPSKESPSPMDVGTTQSHDLTRCPSSASPERHACDTPCP
jgi:hypothetical protein